ncbi:MAG: 3-dehydroquinate synthase [Fidelibacterota bacterium]
MPEIRVDLGPRSYSIRVARGLSQRLPECLEELQAGQLWVLITQESLYQTYGEQIHQLLHQAGMQTAVITIPVGETAKTLKEVNIIYNQLITIGSDRSTTLLALGGGVVGDVTGFVAATFMRGISYVQLPTTLLAMVDSAIGGKTGVNLPTGKNLIGAVYQPRLVILDPAFLATLPAREYISGLAEILKYGLIFDSRFFHYLEENMTNILEQTDEGIQEKIISRSAELKTNIVEQDEFEGDLRRLLNFGHTIGHALETSLGYTTLRHGEAVAYGMMAAGAISYRRNLLSKAEWDFLQSTLRRLPLPAITIPPAEDVLTIIKRDKKVRSGVLHFVLLNGIGQGIIVDDVTDAELTAVLETLESL